MDTWQLTNLGDTKLLHNFVAKIMLENTNRNEIGAKKCVWERGDEIIDRIIEEKQNTGKYSNLSSSAGRRALW